MPTMTRPQTPSERARMLAQEHLTPEQWTELETKDYFYAMCPRNGHVWRIHRFRKPERVNSSAQMIARYCIDPKLDEKYATVPVHDRVLAFKLLIEQDDRYITNCGVWDGGTITGFLRSFNIFGRIKWYLGY